MNIVIKGISFLSAAIFSISDLYAQMFELDSTYDKGRYSFSFTDGFFPVTYGIAKGRGKITFHIPDAAQISVPEDWIVTNHDWGFQVTYDGVFEVYPLGYKTVEISFLSMLTPSEIGTSTSNYTGLVTGPIVLKNGFSQSIEHGDGSFTTAPAGFSNFYWGMPSYEGPQLTSQNLIDSFGFSPDDIKPIAAGIRLEQNQVHISLKNVIEGVTYMLQYKESLTTKNWINVRTFTHEELDDNNTISHQVEGLSGYFQISIL